MRWVWRSRGPRRTAHARFGFGRVEARTGSECNKDIKTGGGSRSTMTVCEDLQEDGEEGKKTWGGRRLLDGLLAQSLGSGGGTSERLFAWA